MHSEILRRVADFGVFYLDHIFIQLGKVAAAAYFANKDQ